LKYRSPSIDADQTTWRENSGKYPGVFYVPGDSEDVRNTSNDGPGTQKTCQRRRSTCFGIQVDVPKTSNAPGESGRSERENNVYRIATPTAKTVDALLKEAIATWPPLLMANSITIPNPIGTEVIFDAQANALLQPLVNMIQGKATKVGCSAKLCTGNPGGVAVCLYDVPAVVHGAGGVIYEVGNGACTTAATCTTHPMSECDTATGLCKIATATTTTAAATDTTTGGSSTTTAPSSGAITPSGGTNARCPNNTGMTDELRYQFRDMHNYRRSQLALGKVTKNTGRYLPRATNMMYMVTIFFARGLFAYVTRDFQRYNCNLEMSAIQLAATCPMSATESGRNIGRVATSSANSWMNAAKEIVKSWWRVVRQYNGPGMKVTFKTLHVGTPIASFTQCSSEYVAVCNYEPMGNIVNQQIYVPGTPCSSCPSGATCTASQGLCTLP
uniref:SCP domain-containing protein n=1 Tax=Heligmosomoides polygyrus TaxID=6339 RepID=A0A183F334_HELPZ